MTELFWKWPSHQVTYHLSCLWDLFVLDSFLDGRIQIHTSSSCRHLCLGHTWQKRKIRNRISGNFKTIWKKNRKIRTFILLVTIEIHGAHGPILLTHSCCVITQLQNYITFTRCWLKFCCFYKLFLVLINCKCFMRERKRPESNKNREPKVEVFTKLTFLNKHIRVGKWEFKGTNSVLGHFSQSLRRLCESFRNQTKPCVQYSPKRDRKFKKNMIIHINSSSCIEEMWKCVSEGYCATNFPLQGASD